MFLKEYYNPQIIRNLRVIIEQVNTQGIPYGYFDGASHSIGSGGGMVIFLAENHCYLMKLGCGIVSNSRVELLTR